MGRRALRLTSRYLNAINDVYPGGGSDAPGLLPGQLGARAFYSEAEAVKLSDTSIATLHEGEYKYVKFLAGTTALVGAVLYWSDRANYVVTPLAPADARSIAGICLNVVTAGRHGVIQKSGLASMLCQSSVTSTTIGNPVFNTDDANTVDGLATGTTWTGGHMCRHLGVAYEALANDGLKLVLITRKID